MTSRLVAAMRGVIGNSETADKRVITLLSSPEALDAMDRRLNTCDGCNYDTGERIQTCPLHGDHLAPAYAAQAALIVFLEDEAT